jgi:uncharacterized protein (TIGR02246 family)
MRRFVLVAFALSLLTACRPGAAPLSDEDIAALNALTDAYGESVLAGDTDGQAAMFAEDGLWWGADAPAVEGRAAIRDAMEPVPGMTVQDFTSTLLEIDGYGDLAFVRGTWSETFVAEGMEEPITITGKAVAIFRKQEDGSWLCTVDIWNTDAPMPQLEEGL